MKRFPKEYRAPADSVMCIGCGSAAEQHPDGRPRLYCSPACRQRAYRARKAQNPAPGVSGSV